MKVSIITSTYNSSKTIEETIRTVLAQDHYNIEHIIIDGASFDNTLNIIKSHNYPNNISLKIVSERDKGIYDALNKGIQLATGDIIGFLHSDDSFASPNILSKYIQEFKEHDCDGVYGDIRFIENSERGKVVRYWKSRPFNKRLIHWGWMPAHTSFFLRRSVYENEGLFDDKLRISADYDFILRVLKQTKYKFQYLPQPCVNMRLGGASTGSLKSIIQKSREDLIVIKRNNIGGILQLFMKNLRKLPQFFPWSQR